MSALKIALYWVNYILAFFVVISVLKSRKSPASTIAWILGIVMVPYVGLLVYLLAGIDRRARKLVRVIPEEVFSAHLAPLLEKQNEIIDAMRRSENFGNRRAARNIGLLNRAASAPVTTGNTLKAFFSGAEMFDSLTADMEAARESIHIESYIWRSDALGERILEILKRKSAEGISVRLVFDGWGSFGKISFSYRRELRKAGIGYVYFSDLSNRVARFNINYRNHRKIAVVDGRIAYTGGMNVAEEYVTGGKRFAGWRDTHIRITGPAVLMLQALFLLDWENSGGAPDEREPLFPPFIPAPDGGGIPIQIAASGPDSRWEGIRLHYLELINGAREEVLIQTPYYIPGEAVEQALVGAALRGVRVMMMTVDVPDQRIPFWAAQSYFPPLLEAGVEIYRYRPGFMHAKMLVQDRVIASVGTCNVDLRSFFLDYEVNAVIYSPEEAQKLARRFFTDIEGCRRLTREDIDNLTLFSRLRNAFFRLLSPLM